MLCNCIGYRCVSVSSLGRTLLTQRILRTIGSTSVPALLPYDMAWDTSLTLISKVWTLVSTLEMAHRCSSKATYSLMWPSQSRLYIVIALGTCYSACSYRGFSNFNTDPPSELISRQKPKYATDALFCSGMPTHSTTTSELETTPLLWVLWPPPVCHTHIHYLVMPMSPQP